jgi:hypothetical protein
MLTRERARRVSMEMMCNLASNCTLKTMILARGMWCFLYFPFSFVIVHVPHNPLTSAFTSCE